MNMREEDAMLTEPEALVYAAAYAATFAADSANYTQESTRAGAQVAAWTAVMFLRGDLEALRRSIDWERVEAMAASFRYSSRKEALK